MRDHGTFYHERQWLVEVTRCFGYRLEILTAPNSDGSLRGGLALAVVPTLLGSSRLVSFPFSFIAGVMAQDVETAVALGGAARELVTELRLRRLEIKQIGGGTPIFPGFERSTRYTTYRVPTQGGEEAIWKRLHVSSTQRSIRRGEKAGVVVVEAGSLDDWRVMARLDEGVQQGHGVPAPPRRFFVDSLRRLQGAGLVDLYLARIPDGRIAAGVVVFKGRRDWVYAFSASDPGLNRDYRATHVILWTALRRAAAVGTTFDLGRVAPEQSSLAQFKERWGADAVQLAYDYWPHAGGLAHARRDRWPLSLATRIWSRLPAPVARLGSVFYRYLG